MDKQRNAPIQQSNPTQLPRRQRRRIPNTRKHRNHGTKHNEEAEFTWNETAIPDTGPAKPQATQ